MNIGLISGWHVHARGYAQTVAGLPGCRIAGVWDNNSARAAALAAEFGCPTLDTLPDLLASPALDGVIVTSETSLHAAHITAALAAGKAVFTEKVLTLTQEDGEAIRAAILANPRPFTISFPQLCRREVRAALSLIRSGELGQITYARVRNAHNGASAGWLPEHFYSREECGGGAMIDLGAHGVYLLNAILGAPLSAKTVFTSVTGHGVEDNAVSVLTYPGGVIGVNETGFVSTANPLTLEVSGTAGSLLLRGDQLSYSGKDDAKKWHTVAESDLPAPLDPPVVAWVKAVASGTPAPFGIADALALGDTMRLILAAEA